MFKKNPINIKILPEICPCIFLSFLLLIFLRLHLLSHPSFPRVILTLMLVAVGVIGGGAFKGGRSVKEGLADA